MPRSPVEAQIRDRVDAFVTEVTSLVREAALEAVQQALGDGAAAPRRAGPRRAKRSTKKKSARRKRRGAGADLSEPVMGYIRSNPGSRAEEIANALGAGAEDVKRALARLRTTGAVRRKGKARGTTYVVSGRGGPAGGRKKASRKKAGRRKRVTRAPMAA